MRVQPLDREKCARLAEALPHVFYGSMAFAFLAVVFGSPGFGLLLLVLGGCAHVARVGVEALLDGEVEVNRGRGDGRPAAAAGAASSDRRPGSRARRPVTRRPVTPRAPAPGVRAETATGDRSERRGRGPASPARPPAATAR